MAQRERRAASGPPSEWPHTTAGAPPSARSAAARSSLAESRVKPPGGVSDWPKPGRSSAMQRALPASSSIVRAQYCQVPPSPCSSRMGGPEPASAPLTKPPSTRSRRWRNATGSGNRRPARLRATVRKRLMNERAVATYSGS